MITTRLQIKYDSDTYLINYELISIMTTSAYWTDYILTETFTTDKSRFDVELFMSWKKSNCEESRTDIDLYWNSSRTNYELTTKTKYWHITAYQYLMTSS